MEISNLTKKRIVESLSKGKRFDGRKLLDFREAKIEIGVSKNAEGSARVKLGDTEVIAGVKVDLAEPYTDHEDEGTLITTCELLPLSSDRFEYGPPRIGAIEIARIVDRGIRESGFIDFKKLCIKKGEKVYSILIDIYPINADGNLIDASCLAATLAVRTAKMPKYDEKNELIKYGEWTNKPIPLSDRTPLTVTLHKLGESIIIDPKIEEEDSSDARVTIAMTRDTKKDEVWINAAQKGLEGDFTEEDLGKMIDIAVEKFKELEKLVNSSLKKK